MEISWKKEIIAFERKNKVVGVSLFFFFFTFIICSEIQGLESLTVSNGFIEIFTSKVAHENRISFRTFALWTSDNRIMKGLEKLVPDRGDIYKR